MAAMAPRLLRDRSAGPDGVFYGTTAYGDAYNGGNVYALSKKGGKWASSTIWAFGGTTGDATLPECDLVMDKSGNIFGTTFYGGTYNLGTVFELSNVSGVWTESVLHSFRGNGDGWFSLCRAFSWRDRDVLRDHTIRR